MTRRSKGHVLSESLVAAAGPRGCGQACLGGQERVGPVPEPGTGERSLTGGERILLVVAVYIACTLIAVVESGFSPATAAVRHDYPPGRE